MIHSMYSKVSSTLERNMLVKGTFSPLRGQVAAVCVDRVLLYFMDM